MSDKITLEDLMKSIDKMSAVPKERAGYDYPIMMPRWWIEKAIELGMIIEKDGKYIYGVCWVDALKPYREPIKGFDYKVRSINEIKLK